MLIDVVILGCIGAILALAGPFFKTTAQRPQLRDPFQTLGSYAREASAAERLRSNGLFGNNQIVEQ